MMLWSQSLVVWLSCKRISSCLDQVRGMEERVSHCVVDALHVLACMASAL